MSKQPAQRRPKPGVRSHHPTGDLIALGPKTQGARNSDSDLKPIQAPKPIPVQLPKKSISLGSSERKRESPNSTLGTPKRTKVLNSPQYSPHSTKGGEGERRPSSSSAQYFSSHISPIEVNPSDLERLVLEAETNEDRTRVDGLLLGAIKTLKTNKSKPDPVTYLSLLYLAKTKPECFASSRVIEALTSLLKRDSILNIKTNKALASLVPIMTVNILLYIFQDTEDWPETFVKVFVEDSLGDRIWVDSEACQIFVDNILTAFGTKQQPKTISRQSSDPGSKSEQLPTLPVTAATTTTIFMPSKEGEDTITEEIDLSSNEEDATSVIPRFTSPSVKYNVSTYLLEIVTEQLNRRQPVDNISRNLLRLLMVTCGNNQVRLLVSQRIEVWLQNPKLTRPAQELLSLLCLNCNSHSHEDIEIISNLIKMRLKTKLLSNHYVSCIRELLSQHTENLSTVMKHVIYNELSNARNPNNMNLLATMFQYKPEASSKILAMVFQDLLMNKEDYLRACRALLREVVRFLRYGPLNFVALCRGFMQERTDSQFKDLDGSVKERMFMSLADLIAMATMLSITPAVKERYADFKRGDTKGLSVLQEFQKNVSTIQRDCVYWLHTVVPKMFNVTGQDFHTCLQKVLYLETIDNYCTKDGWPQECDRSLFYSLSSEVPVQEDTLMRIIIIGLANELPLNAPEALDIADRIVRRAATIKTGVTQLKVTRQELLDAMLNLCAYHHPKDIQLPSGYIPPKLAISNLYWKAWMLLTIVASLNPDSIGQSGWENFPMLKSLMEMIMTNNCVFPPPTIASTTEEKEQMIAEDRQLVQIEKEEILQFESHLAAATTGVNITESNSLLLSQLITMDPVGPARRPPQSFMDELKTANSSLKLGQKLCRSRQPDFLLDIIQRQGTSQSMPWLAELVQSSEGSLDVLPVQCLCEFLLMEQQSSEKANEELTNKKMNNQRHVLLRLRCLLNGSSADGDATVEVLEYFMRRLSSGITKERNAALKGLELVLSQESSTNDDDVSVVSFSDDVSLVNAIEEMSFQESTTSTLPNELKWLLVHLPRLPHFDIVKPICCFALRQCCQVEIEPQRLQAYLVFLSQHSGGPTEEEFTDTLLEISQLVIARPTIFNQVLEGSPAALETFQALLGMYQCAVEHAMTVQDNSYFESNTQDQLFAQWSKDTLYPGKAATMHALVIQASILLLTWPEPTENPLTYRALLDCWCPENGHIRVYLTDTGEEAMLLPEWLRLRMIRASSHRVVDAAMTDLVPSQLVLFVQSFGIPVYSMSKLLQQLDLAAEEDALSVSEAVIDKAYMVQLVEVQQQRGAEGGTTFCSLLADEPHLKTPTAFNEENDIPKPLVIKPLHPEKHELMQSQEDSIEEMILKCLQLEVTNAGETRQIENNMKRFLTNDLISLNKHKNTDCSWSEDMISSLIYVLNTSDSDNVNMVCDKKSNFLCAILRLLGARQNVLPVASKLRSSFPELLKTLSSKCLPDGPLTKIVQQLTKQFNIQTEKPSHVEASKRLAEISQEKFNDESVVRGFILQTKKVSSEFTIDTETAVKACMNIKSKNPQSLEQFCKALFSVIINQIGQPEESPWNSSQSLPLQTCIQTLTSLLQDENHVLSRGLFVDWLETLDPEIVDVHPLLQRQILFSDRPHVETQNRSLTTSSSNSYLLASLAHNSKYSTLQDCLDWLLGQHTNRLTPGAALDFLWTCYHLPRLWQGREQRSTTHSVDKEVLSLTQAQTCHVALLILSEIEDAVKQFCEKKGVDWENLCQETTLPDGELRSQLNKVILGVTQQRMPLMLQCCVGQDLKPIVDHSSNDQRYPKWLRAPFLIHLYLAHPHIYSGLDKQDLFSSSAFTEATECQMDSLCHCALTALADCRPGREYEDSANTSSLLCRKIASTHPMLFLRHLPMINCLLRGRVHLTSKEFNINQHLLLFSHILGILDLLRPYVFSNDKFIEDSLEDMLTVYFELIQSSCLSSKELAGVVSKFAEFFYHFCTSKPDKSFPILQANAAVLHDLLSNFPELSSLKCLSSALSVPSAAPLPKGSFHSLIMPLETSSWTPAQLAPVIQQLSPSEPLPDIIRALTDLDETSKRRVDILQHFMAELNRLTTNPDNSVRTKAHTLIQRHMRQNPRDAQKFVESFMECLTCTSPDVTLTAAKFTPEFIVLGCEYSSLLLQKLFSVAVNERLDVVSSLARSIQLLNLEFSK